jgi:hypothetical protein
MAAFVDDTLAGFDNLADGSIVEVCIYFYKPTRQENHYLTLTLLFFLA